MSAICTPTGLTTNSTVMASATTGAASPTCYWTCDALCASVSITAADGLPVELMDFGVVDGSGGDEGDSRESFAGPESDTAGGATTGATEDAKADPAAASGSG